MSVYYYWWRFGLKLLYRLRSGRRKNSSCKVKKKNTKSTHGSGCIFSSALTIFLAKGVPLIESLKKSKKFIIQQIDRSPILNVKYGPLI